jgi:glycosyltransferase involved in cell wall biosynthesis
MGDDRAASTDHDRRPRDIEVVVLVGAFPVLSETFVVTEALALAELGHTVRVEASRRADPAATGVEERLSTHYLEGQPRRRDLLDLARLVVRHPFRSVADLVAQRRWRREEDVPPLRSLAPAARRLASGPRTHLHAHFAREGALTAMRLSRLVGAPYSVTTHAYDIYTTTTNLREKLQGAAFVTAGSDYSLGDVKEIVGPRHAARIHKIVMGVDPERFKRSTDYPGKRVVVAVGRLVRKKGFRHLLEAVALLRRSSPIDSLIIVGDGPLHDGLRSRADEFGVTDTVEWMGARSHEEVREVLERADVLAMPCIVLRDGERDGSPTVVKEALAMEVPVVASDEVGLPEVVREPWGRIVPSRDASALASALADVLARSREERVAMGRAGRAWMLETCNPLLEAEKLSRLIEAAASGDRTAPG